MSLSANLILIIEKKKKKKKEFGELSPVETIILVWKQKMHLVLNTVSWVQNKTEEHAD